MSHCTKCCLYYFIRNDFSVNQALMKISATKIKFSILKERILGDFPWLDICWSSQAAGCRRHRSPSRASSEGGGMEPQAHPDFQLVPTAIPGFKVCFLVQRSGRGVAALPPALGFVKINRSCPRCGQTQAHVLPTSVTQHLSFCYIHMSPEEKVST